MIDNILKTPLQSLMQDNPVDILNFLKNNFPQDFEEQISAADENGHSFYYKLIKNSKYKSYQNEIVSFSLINGYYPKMAINQKRHSLWITDKKTISEYLLLWDNINDDSLSKLTSHLGREYIKKFEDDGYLLLHAAYKLKFSKTISLLTSYGLSFDKKNKEGLSVLDIAEKDPNLLNLYWSLNSSLSDGKFNSIKKLLIEKAKNSTTSHTSSFQVKEISKDIKKYISEQIPFFSNEQREEIVAIAAIFQDMSIYTQTIKMLGSSKSKYSYKSIPPWLFLNESKGYDIIQHFLDNKTPIDQYDSQSKSYYIDKLCGYLNNISYDDSSTYSYRKDTRSIRAGYINIKLSDVKDPDFWLTINKQTQKPWFYHACQNKDIISVFGNTWLLIKPQELRVYNHLQQQKSLAIYEKNFKTKLQWNTEQNICENNTHIIREIFDNTWFYKDEKNITCLEYILQKQPHYFNESGVKNYFSKCFIIDKKFSIFSSSEKETMFNLIIAPLGKYDRTHELLKDLFDNMQNDPKINWMNLKINVDNKNLLETLIPGINSILSYHQMSKNLNGIQSKIVPKNKI